MINRFTVLLVTVLFLASCGEKDNPGTEDPGYGYFPLDSGNYLIYDVSFNKKDLSGWQEQNYQLKELVADTFSSGDEISYRLERYIRTNDTYPWPETPDTVWTVRIKSDRVIKTEENQRFVKLVFPVRNGRTWDGNAENTAGDDIYEFSAKDKPYQINNEIYPETVLVIHQADTTNLVKRDLRYEVFAKDKGLIFKRNEILNYDFSTGDTLNGNIYTQTLVSSGP